MHCESCISALEFEKGILRKEHDLIKQKDKGGLKYPAKSVMEVCFFM